MAQRLPNRIEIEDREHAASEVVEIVLNATAAELAACMNLVQDLREKANVDVKDSAFKDALHEVLMAMRERAHELGIPNRIEDQTTRPLEVKLPSST